MKTSDVRPLLGALILCAAAIGCSTSPRNPTPTAAATTWQPVEEEGALYLQTSEDRSGQVQRLSAPTELTVARGGEGPSEERVIILRLASLVTPGSVVECRPKEGMARAVPPRSLMLPGDTPGPLEDAAIENGARGRLFAMNGMKRDGLQISSRSGVLQVKVREVEVDQAAELFNALLSLEGVREVRLETQRPFKV